MRTAVNRVIVVGVTAWVYAAPCAVTPPSNLHFVPTINRQPQSQAVFAGQTATFTVAAASYAPALTYNWTFNGVSVGSNSSSYTRSNCQLADNGGGVRVTVSDSGGSIASSTATLTVNPAGTIYYASPSGNSGNTGLSPTSPWPLQYALSHAGVSNTVIALDGVYSSASGFTIVDGYCRNVRAQNKWKAVLTGATGYSEFTIYGASYCTVDGFCITNSLNRGIDVEGTFNTVRNCWIRDNGWTGIAASTPGNSNNIIEYCLVELSKHGDYPDTTNRGYGLYLSGPNNTVRNNVFRYNSGAGIHYYTGDSGTPQTNTRIYNNLTYGHTKTGAYGGMVVVANGFGLGGENYVYGNTILDGLQVDYGTVDVNNNIILPGVTYPSKPLYSCMSTPVIIDNYNLSTLTINPAGANDVITSYTGIGFVNPANGLYWISSTSQARGHALSSTCGPVDFFGNQQASVTDIGAFQYNAGLAGDTRVLDPSPANPDYWTQP